MKTGICPKCQSDKIIPELIIDKPVPTMAMSRGLKIEYAKGLNHKSVTAYVCGECGYLELYVQKPAGLWENTQKSREQHS